MKTLLFTSVFAAIVLSSCTENTRTKSWGTTTVDLAPNTKIVSATWTGSDLWYLTRPMHTNEDAEILTLVEHSSFGLIEGKVVFSETKIKKINGSPRNTRNV